MTPEAFVTGTTYVRKSRVRAFLENQLVLSMYCTSKNDQFSEIILYQ